MACSSLQIQTFFSLEFFSSWWVNLVSMCCLNPYLLNLISNRWSKSTYDPHKTFDPELLLMDIWFGFANSQLRKG